MYGWSSKNPSPFREVEAGYFAVRMFFRRLGQNTPLVMADPWDLVYFTMKMLQVSPWLLAVGFTQMVSKVSKEWAMAGYDHVDLESCKKRGARSLQSCLTYAAAHSVLVGGAVSDPW